MSSIGGTYQKFRTEKIDFFSGLAPLQTVDKKLFSPPEGGRTALSTNERIAEFLDFAIQAKFAYVNKLKRPCAAFFIIQGANPKFCTNSDNKATESAFLPNGCSSYIPAFIWNSVTFYTKFRGNVFPFHVEFILFF